MDFLFEWILKPALGSAFAVAVFALIWKIGQPYFTSYTAEKGKNVATREDIREIAHLGESGKNLATKEDIAEITRKVESVRTGFITSLELLKLELGKKAFLHQLFAQKELEALARIWDVLFELQLATRELRPFMDRVFEDESAEERLHRKYKAWAAAHDAFMDAIQKNQLFLDPGLHRELFAIKEASRFEAIDFEAAVTMARSRGNLDSIGGHSRARENVGEMEARIRSAFEMIRKKFDL